MSSFLASFRASKADLLVFFISVLAIATRNVGFEGHERKRDAEVKDSEVKPIATTCLNVWNGGFEEEERTARRGRNPLSPNARLWQHRNIQRRRRIEVEVAILIDYLP